MIAIWPYSVEFHHEQKLFNFTIWIYCLGLHGDDIRTVAYITSRTRNKKRPQIMTVCERLSPDRVKATPLRLYDGDRTTSVRRLAISSQSAVRSGQALAIGAQT
jgi:hypothetical protein